MVNASILAAFERMWQHVVSALSGKSDVNHTHSEYMTVNNPTGTGSFSMNRKANTDIGNNSHAEGLESMASGIASHAEGYNNSATGYASHAEGANTIASGFASHAEGGDTIASSNYQHVQGKYNIEDTNNKYAHIVGNGTSEDERSNAHTIGWNGLGWFAGGLKVGGTGQDDTIAKEVATKDYVDNSIAEIPDGIYVHDEEPVDAEDGTL